MKPSVQNIESLLITIQKKQVLFNRDVAQLYGLQIKRINEAVKNNKHKFPANYLVTLTSKEWDSLRSKRSTANFSKTRFPRNQGHPRPTQVISWYQITLQFHIHFIFIF